MINNIEFLKIDGGSARGVKVSKRHGNCFRVKFKWSIDFDIPIIRITNYSAPSGKITFKVDFSTARPEIEGVIVALNLYSSDFPETGVKIEA